MKDRRSFLKNTGLLIGGLPVLEYLDQLPKIAKADNTKIDIYNTKWGFQGSLEAFMVNSKKAGYDGVELWVPQEEVKRKEMVRLAIDHGLKLGLLAGNSGGTVDDNLNSFKSSIKHAISCSPTFINCHSGRDFFKPEENKLFIEHTIVESVKSGIPIYHETHRGRILFNAPIAEHFIDLYEELRLTLDISHWTVVHESLLENQLERVDKALSRTGHIHSRIGFQEAPQIPNPDDRKYKKAIDAHFAWWDKVVKLKSDRNETLTMTTEFGPPPYMWTYPYKDKPLASVWDVNVLMKNMWKKRYL